MSQTPFELGYRAAPEWAPHVGTWLAWPHNRDTWPGHFEPIPPLWREIVLALSEFEPVHLLAGGAVVWAQACTLLGQADHADRLEARLDFAGRRFPIALYDLPTNDVWTRDYGPMFLRGPAGAPPALVDWGYNAWGDKYDDRTFDLDDRLPEILAAKLGYQRFTPGVILEGGAVDFNGQGSVLTTEECLLNPNRNPGLTKADYVRLLRDYCGAPHIIWLDRGIVGDDTDGHIDELARFVGPRTVVAAYEPDATDDNYEPLAENLRRLELATDEAGRPLEIIRLRQPRPLFCEGQRLPGSYLNFFIANGGVLVPVYDDPADEAALATLARCFPGREMRPIRAVELAWGLGALHCITQQQVAPHV